MSAGSILVDRQLLADLVDDSPCRFDHDGNCQEHGFFWLAVGEVCPQERLKAVLA